jgi:hypothetical protein
MRVTKFKMGNVIYRQSILNWILTNHKTNILSTYLNYISAIPVFEYIKKEVDISTST